MEFLARLGLDAKYMDSLVDKVADKLYKFFDRTKDEFLRGVYGALR